MFGVLLRCHEEGYLCNLRDISTILSNCLVLFVHLSWCAKITHVLIFYLVFPYFRFKDKHYGSSGGATSGLTSSLAFTPVQVSTLPFACSRMNSISLTLTQVLRRGFSSFVLQGIELSNPQAHGNLLGSGTQSTYFSEIGTFSKIKRT